MTGKRKRYTADFKAKVALEALRGELTTAQLAAKHSIHQTMVGEWKRQAVAGLASVFSGKSAAQESAKAAEADLEKLQPKTVSHGACAVRLLPGGRERRPRLAQSVRHAVARPPRRHRQQPCRIRAWCRGGEAAQRLQRRPCRLRQ